MNTDFLSSIPSEWIAFVILGGMVIGFVRERYPAELVAFLGAAAMLALGMVGLPDFQSALANPAPWTIAAMFVLSGALIRTGLIAYLTRHVKNQLKTRPKFVLIMGAFLILVLSAFMNNTPVVVVMIPLVIQLSSEMGKPASKLLIPLSYLAIFGGMLTLIGTSTNLLVDGVAREAGLRAFTIFEVTPLAMILAIWGAVYLAIFSGRLLPERSSMAEMLVGRKRASFFTEVAVPAGSPVIGQNVMQIDLFKRDRMRVIDVLRNDESLRRQLGQITLAAGDRVVLKTPVSELLGLKESAALEMVDTLSQRSTHTVEALISPGCTLVGRRLGALRLRRRYGVYTLAVHRREQNLGKQLDDVVIRVGDTLLLEGAPEDIARLSTDARMTDLNETQARSYRRDKAGWVLLIWMGMLTAAGTGLVPIFYAAILAVALVLAIRAMDLDEAIASIEGNILLLIFSMLVVGAGMQNSGAVDLIVSGLSPLLAGLPPFLMIWCLVLITSTLTELLSNNAVAVILTPIAITLASSLGLDARPFVVAVMIGASCAFATPIGYQTNTLVYGPGGYKFTDFTKIGLPLNITTGLLASLLIPYFFPL